MKIYGSIKLQIVSLAIIMMIAGSCNQGKKSDLVKRLEGIFYKNDFASIPEKIFDTADFGAVGDSTTLATRAIQDAIDAAAEAGGGKVVFQPGIYLSGAIFLKSNVELHLGEGVVIRAIQDDSQYPERPTRIAGIEMEWPSALINVYQQKNVRITGSGIIDGNGKYWWDKFWGDPPRSGGMWEDYKKLDIRWAVDYDCKRVRPVVVYKSEDVLLKDFTVQRAGFWTVSLTYSQRVYVDGLIIKNNIGGFGPSSDGINTDSSSDVLVENCDIDCNDDNLCIKSGRDADGLRVNRPAENIVYRNCITRAGHGLFTLGSETSGGMRNIEVYGLEAKGTNTGIRFKSAQVRGGLVENISFHDIKMEDVNSPFHFELNWYPEYSYPKIPEHIPDDQIKDRWRLLTQPVVPAERGIPEFCKMSFEDISVKNAEQAFYANAYPEKPMHSLTWKNILIEANSYGVIRHARDWTMENVVVRAKSSEPLTVEDGKNLIIPGVPINEVVYKKPGEKSSAIDKQIEDIISKNAERALILFNEQNEAIIQQGDTLAPQQDLVAFVQLTDAEIEFYEPLGDGFYVSPVHIIVSEKNKQIDVRSQKTHDWQFKIPMSESPDSIKDCKEWSYDLVKKQVLLKKSGKNFTISLD